MKHEQSKPILSSDLGLIDCDAEFRAGWDAAIAAAANYAENWVAQGYDDHWQDMEMGARQVAAGIRKLEPPARERTE